ncbi:MAG: SUMF1/EgtB/PvdO family nonheme iron enzyme [Polyangiaceae bacterium]
MAEARASAPARAPEAPLASNPTPVASASAKTELHDPSCDADSLCNGESCCTKLLLPTGSYDDKKAGKVSVQAFYLDKYELTVGRVRAWVRAGSPVPPVGETLGLDSAGGAVRWASSWQVQTEAQLKGWERYDTWQTAQQDKPKNFLDWYTAAAVCHFAGGRLPSDAEWRYAAVGGDENRPYPWGADAQTPERAVYNCMGDGDQSCSLADILPVGSRPLGAGRWGHMDLAGSMFEWTIDAAGPETAVSRGGGFCYIGGQDRRAKRVTTSENVRRESPSTTSHMVGARCAFDADDGPRVALRGELDGVVSQ